MLTILINTYYGFKEFFSSMIATLKLLYNEILSYVVLSKIKKSNGLVKKIFSLLNMPYNLNLRGFRINDEHCESIAELLIEQYPLYSLNLSANYLKCSQLRIISQALAINKTLKYLDLTNNPYEDTGLVELAWALKQNNTLTHLKLDSRFITDRGWGFIRKALEKNITLIFLDRRGNNKETLNIKKIEELIKRNKDIDYFINLCINIFSGATKSNNGLNEGIYSNEKKLLKGQELININQKILKHDPNWRIYTLFTFLSTVKLPEHYKKQIKDFGSLYRGYLPDIRKYKPPKKQITLETVAPLYNFINITTSLCLQGENINDLQAISIANILTSNSSISHLYFDFNSITNYGCKIILSTISKNKTLKSLKISLNKFTFEQQIYIANALKENNALTYLALRYNPNCVTQAFDSIIKKLKKNSTLRTLDLTCDFISSDMLQNILDRLAFVYNSNTMLTELILRSRELGSYECEYICRIIAQRSTLTYLNLSNCVITAYGWGTLIPAFECNNTLTHFVISAKNIQDTEIQEEIAKGLTNNITLTSFAIENIEIENIKAKKLAKIIQRNKIISYFIDLCINSIGKYKNNTDLNKKVSIFNELNEEIIYNDPSWNIYQLFRFLRTVNLPKHSERQIKKFATLYCFRLWVISKEGRLYYGKIPPEIELQIMKYYIKEEFIDYSNKSYARIRDGWELE